MICVICRHDLSGFNVTTLECNHQFHSECLINHFRCPREWSFSANGYGACPLCRQGPLGGAASGGAATTSGRVSLIRRLSRKYNLHPAINKCLCKLKNAEKSHREAKQKNRAFRKEHVEICKELAANRHSIWRTSAKVWKCKHSLASFDPLAMLDCPYAFRDS